MAVTETHPILGERQRKTGPFWFDGRELKGYIGEPIAVSLLANGIRAFRTTEKKQEPRGLFCGIGQCNDCVVVVNGIPNVRSCVTLLEEGMRVESQQGLGKVGTTW
jgi:predicted molibdopterin-dependent oxidoreductase YjgC